MTTQISLIRQIGEALQYAHNNRIVHRGLSPLAVWVKPVTGTAHDVTVRIGDWQGAGSVSSLAATHTATAGVTALAPTAPSDDDALTETFAAPEGAWSATADRVRLDVYGLGALAFYLLTGQTPGLRLRPDLTREVWAAATADVSSRICLPTVDERALRGLKFNEALPQRLAEATMAQRLAAADEARLVLAEPIRLLGS